ncbi:hypothetical protein ABW19_dt0203902 [Dactylella cylindrospora]|nr:hypothetical protein ABW19_dt0203902 [Dactylella cylindrospora]
MSSSRAICKDADDIVIYISYVSANPLLQDPRLTKSLLGPYNFTLYIAEEGLDDPSSSYLNCEFMVNRDTLTAIARNIDQSIAREEVYVKIMRLVRKNFDRIRKRYEDKYKGQPRFLKWIGSFFEHARSYEAGDLDVWELVVKYVGGNDKAADGVRELEVRKTDGIWLWEAVMDKKNQYAAEDTELPELRSEVDSAMGMPKYIDDF